jgi:hypothetical protein
MPVEWTPFVAALDLLFAVVLGVLAWRILPQRRSLGLLAAAAAVWCLIEAVFHARMENAVARFLGG